MRTLWGAFLIAVVSYCSHSSSPPSTCSFAMGRSGSFHNFHLIFAPPPSPDHLPAASQHGWWEGAATSPLPTCSIATSVAVATAMVECVSHIHALLTTLWGIVHGSCPSLPPQLQCHRPPEEYWSTASTCTDNALVLSFLKFSGGGFLQT